MVKTVHSIDELVRLNAKDFNDTVIVRGRGVYGTTNTTVGTNTTTRITSVTPGVSWERLDLIPFNPQQFGDDGNASKVIIDGAPLTNIVLRGRPLAGDGEIAAVWQTVADMVARGNPESGVRPVMVTGYWAPNDGGGGLFYATNTVVATNAGMRIFSGTEGWSWERVVDGSVSPRMFGARGDGVTDDRNALQAAINAVRGTKYVLNVTPGDYRIVATKAIYLGSVHIRGSGGKLWRSLPNDYTNSNSYATTEVYTASNVLDRDGSMTTWLSTDVGYSGMPWNGKTEMFTGATDATIEDLWIDDGWGTIDAPEGVIPITGIRNDNAEFTYYQCFNASIRTKFRNCTFRNSPGAVIEVGQDLTVTDCTFGEFGDHVFYMGGGSGNLRFANNSIQVGRAAVSTNGDASFVFSAYRQAVKLRGTYNVFITQNNLVDTNRLVSFCELETSSAQPADGKNIQISGNTIDCNIFVEMYSFRDDGAVDHRLRDIDISRNMGRVATRIVHFVAACDNLRIDGNSITNGNILLAGYPRFTDPLKNVRIVNNVCSGTNDSQITLSGYGDSITIAGNQFANTATLTTLKVAIYFGNTFAIDSLPIYTQPTRFTRMLVADNTLKNMFSLGLETGYPPLSGATTYPFASYDMPEGTVNVYSIISSGGAIYSNSVTVTGGEAGSADWPAVTQENGTMWLMRNRRVCSEPAFSPSNSSQLFSFNAATNIQRQAWTLYHQWNENINTLGDPVSFNLGNQAAALLPASSNLKSVNTETLNVTNIVVTTNGVASAQIFGSSDGSVKLDINGTNSRFDINRYYGSPYLGSFYAGAVHDVWHIDSAGTGTYPYRFFDSSNNVAGISVGNILANGSVSVIDELYGIGWDGSTNVPTKNAVYDKIESLGSLDADLTAIADLTGLGLIARTGAGTAATRTITGDTEIVVSNGNGVSGNPALSIGPGISRTTHTHAAADIVSGTMATARLGSGTANTNTYLRGDQTWATIPSGGVVTNHTTIALSDLTTDLTTTTSANYWIAPYALTIIKVEAYLIDPSSSGAVTVNVKKNGTTIFSTKATIDATETTSATAATPAVVSTATAAAGDIYTMDIDTAGADAKGLQFRFYYTAQ